MIDQNLLRKAGWSEDLIAAAVKVASQITAQEEVSVQTEIALSETDVVEGSETIDFAADTTPVSIWPRF